jgi:hypothetical protein
VAEGVAVAKTEPSELVADASSEAIEEAAVP